MKGLISALYYYYNYHIKASGADQHVQKVNACIGVIDAWMSSNRLKLNSYKNTVWLGSY